MEVAEMQPDEYLQGHHICTLATATKAGTPHASAFWYASEGLDLYLAVDERSTTAHNLSENPYVAGAIYADSADWRPGRSPPIPGGAAGAAPPSPAGGRQASSLHFQGRAVLLTTPGERTRAIEVFGRKFPETTMPDVPSVRWYRVVVYDLRAVESGGKQQGTFFAVNFREDLVHQVFRGVTPGQAQEIATQLTPRGLKEGEERLRPGSRGETFFIVVSGEVEVYQEEDGRERHIAILGPGAFVGEMALRS